MNILTSTKVPPKLALTALLSSGITIVVSISYIILSIIGLVYRNDCEAASPLQTDASQYFWHAIFRVYFQDAHCGFFAPVQNVTESHSVFVFLALTLSFSLLTLIAAGALAAIIHLKKLSQYMNIFVFAYISTWVGALVVDITFASHLGLDYTNLTNELSGTAALRYEVDVLRQGALILMTIVLKGYVTHAINLVLILLLVVYACENQDTSNREEHPIHKMGPLSAYNSQPRRDPWSNRNETSTPSTPPYRGSQMNNGFQNDEEPSTARTDFSNNRLSPFNRSNSWQRQPSPLQNSTNPGSRPFSYLEEIRRPVPVLPPSTPSGTDRDGWRRDQWPPAPPVPAPDYSPHGPRRLKSALKPAYM